MGWYVMETDSSFSEIPGPIKPPSPIRSLSLSPARRKGLHSHTACSPIMILISYVDIASVINLRLIEFMVDAANYN